MYFTLGTMLLPVLSILLEMGVLMKVETRGIPYYRTRIWREFIWLLILTVFLREFALLWPPTLAGTGPKCTQVNFFLQMF